MMILTFVFTRNKHLHLFLYVITRVGKHETLKGEEEIRNWDKLSINSAKVQKDSYTTSIIDRKQRQQ